jgi:hypothetical protein
VQLDRALGNTLLREEGGYLEPLISLELNHLTEFVVVDESAVASEFLGEHRHIAHSTIRVVKYVPS